MVGTLRFAHPTKCRLDESSMRLGRRFSY